MADIGKVALLISANAGPAVAAMEKTKQATTSLAATSAKDMKKIEKAYDDILKKSTLYKAAKATLASPLTGASSLARTATSGLKYGAMGLIGAGAAAAVATPIITASGINSIMQADRQARELGLSVNELRTLMLAAGDGADAMAAAMGHFGHEMANAFMQQSGALRSLDALEGFTGKALSGDFLSKTTLAKYEEIVDQLAAIPNNAQRAAMAMRFFGDSASAILPAISGGKAGVERAKQMLGNFGLGVGEKDLASVRQVAQTWREIGTLRQGLTNQFTLGISPFIGEISKAFDIAKLNISGLRGIVADVAESLIRAGGTVIALWSDTSLIEGAWKAATASMKAGFLDMIAAVYDAITDLFGKVPGIAARAGIFMATGVAPGKAAEDAAKAAKAAREAFENNLTDAGPMKAAQGIIDRAREVMAAGGKDMGADKLFAPMAHLKALMQEAGQAAQNLRDPFEQFTDQMNKIGEMTRAGVFAGNDDLLARMTHQAFAQAASKLPAVAGPTAALEKGSREAYSAVEAFRRGGDRQDVPGILKAMKEEAKRMQEEQNRILGQILKQMEKGNLNAQDFLERGI